MPQRYQRPTEQSSPASTLLWGNFSTTFSVVMFLHNKKVPAGMTHCPSPSLHFWSTGGSVIHHCYVHRATRGCRLAPEKKKTSKSTTLKHKANTSSSAQPLQHTVVGAERVMKAWRETLESCIYASPPEIHWSRITKLGRYLFLH